MRDAVGVSHHPFAGKVMVPVKYLVYRIRTGTGCTLAAGPECRLSRNRQHFKALGGASAIDATQFYFWALVSR